MLIAAKKIRSFSSRLTLETFKQSRLHQSAIIRESQVIGEASRLVSEPVKTTHAAIPWTQIAGMRNRIIHEYFRMDLEILWQAVKNDHRPLIMPLERLVPPEEEL